MYVCVCVFDQGEAAFIAESDNDQFIVGSRILSINSYPCSSIDYAAIKRRLETSPWPLKLELGV